MASRLERFRKNKDEFFKTDPHSPLMPAQQDDFEGLSYFPENDDLVFEVEMAEDAVSHEPVELDTTTGDPQTFVPAGLIQIEIEQTPITLTLFREQGRGRYFLPFRDATSGEETYDL